MTTAMDIDPIDDGPIQKDDLKQPAKGSPYPSPAPPIKSVAPITQEDEARQVIEMLRGDDVSERVSAARRLEAVAAVLGEKRTRLVRWAVCPHSNTKSVSNGTISHLLIICAFIRQELLPFLTDAADDEDEVLLAVASSLGQLVEHVGGTKHAHCLLLPLEILLTVGEWAVDMTVLHLW
jgi:hypothetical protein